MKKLGIGISPALSKENYKMHWYLPVLIFLGYFFTGIFPLIMNMESLGILPEENTYSRWPNYALNSLENENPFFTAPFFILHIFLQPTCGYIQ